MAEKRVDFSYTAVGRFDQIKRYNDAAGTSAAAVSTYAYDNDDRLTALTHAQGAATLAGYTWTFDDAGRITGLVSPDGTAAYAYDANGQLTATDNSTLADESYSYDANGNRTMSGYVTGGDNRLSSDGTYNYAYDAEGNRTSRTHVASGAVTEYAWDHRNRLTDVTFRASAGGAVTKTVKYVYDANDLRIGTLVDANADGTYDSVERFALDGQDVALVFTAGVVSHRYLHGAGVDQVLAEETAGTGGGVRWLLADNQAASATS